MLDDASFVIKSLGLYVTLLIVVSNLLKIKLQFGNIIKYTFVFTVISTVFMFFNNPFFYIFACILMTFISIKISLGVSSKKLIIPLLVSFCFYQFVLNIYLIIINGFHLNNTLLNSTAYYSVLYILFVPLSTICISYFLKKSLRDYFFLDNIHIIQNKAYGIISVLLIELSLIQFYMIYNNMQYSVHNIINNYYIISAVNMLTILTLVLFYMYVKKYFDNHFISIKNETLSDSYKNIEGLNRELRAQKHDFLNHLQVISGLLQLKKYSECFDYVVNLNNLSHDSNSIRTSLISVNALLNSKQLRAKHKNIRMELDISSQLDTSTFNIQDWEITNILGNLIDNAMYEESKVSTKDKYIRIKIKEDNHYYKFSVYNKNSYIGQDKKRRIFRSGFSTKGRDGHGMGLYIVKNIVDKYKGSIELNSGIDLGTEFSIYFPKYTKSLNNSKDLKSYPPQESLGAQIL